MSLVGALRSQIGTGSFGALRARSIALEITGTKGLTSPYGGDSHTQIRLNGGTITFGDFTAELSLQGGVNGGISGHATWEDGKLVSYGADSEPITAGISLSYLYNDPVTQTHKEGGGGFSFVLVEGKHWSSTTSENALMTLQRFSSFTSS